MKNYRFIAAAIATAVLAVSSITGCATTAQGATDTQAAVTIQEKSSGKEKEDRNRPDDQLLTLVNEGKITQETYDAIQKYLKENRPELPDGEEKTSKEISDADTKTPPEKPADGDNRGGERKGPGGMPVNKDTLDKLLSDSIITQAEYDLIKEVIPEKSDMPDRPTEAEQL